MRRKILGGKFSGTVKRSSDLYPVCGGGDLLLLREYGDMAIILAVVLLNATVGVIQEGKAKNRWRC